MELIRPYIGVSVENIMRSHAYFVTMRDGTIYAGVINMPGTKVVTMLEVLLIYDGSIRYVGKIAFDIEDIRDFIAIPMRFTIGSRYWVYYRRYDVDHTILGELFCVEGSDYLFKDVDGYHDRMGMPNTTARIEHHEMISMEATI